jgi:hypothetical protein
MRLLREYFHPPYKCFNKQYGYSNLITAGGGGAGMVGSPEIAQHHLKIPVNNRPSISSGFISSLAQIGNVSPSLPNPSGHLGFDCITYSSEVPASPLKCPPEMVDKTTQAKEGCEKCVFLHSIMDGRKTTEQSSRSPKVIGRFVFSELNGGPSQHQPNYGTLAREEEKDILPAATHHLPAQNHLISSSNNNQGGGGRRKFYSQGETLIMNERSFLI